MSDRPQEVASKAGRLGRGGARQGRGGVPECDCQENSAVLG